MQDFPNKISMGSVRSKTLVLFMINYVMKRYTINSERIVANDIDQLRMGNLFAGEKKAENFIPIVYVKTKIKSDNGTVLTMIEATAKQKEYKHYLKKQKDYECYFLTKEMKEVYEESKDKVQEILKLRRNFIWKEEQEFIKKLDGMIDLSI
jgi:hypothetical protein